ncbi:Serine/threonine-protein kinase PknD [bioreactor metagenome]|uniref:Serine/threonine-protein kinase PknD n=1 Tax=bioreactor metagenome TaxID=1076179 RepID=A0A644WW85_9ZZZZ
MPSKVILKVTKGELSGKEFAYSEKEQLFVGRQEDCAIVLPDKSVSRYHCMLEVTPPYVTVRDFGSLNGTFLNGEKIGGRERAISAEDAQKEYHEEFDLHDGNTLGLGKHCELTLRTIAAICCADCGKEVFGADDVGNGETTPDDAPQTHMNDKGEPICEACYSRCEAKKRDAALAVIEKERVENARIEQARLEEERLEGEKKRKEAEAVAEELAKKLKAAADRAAKDEAEREHMKAVAAAAALKKAEEELQRKQNEQRKAEEEQRERVAKENKRREAECKRLEEMKNQQAEKRCMGCGRQFTPKSLDNNLCPKCVEDREKVLEAILKQALGVALVQQEKDSGPAILKGFRKVKRLGAGGMGEVWLVQEEKTGKKFALKTMLPQVAADTQAKDSFLREALLGEALDHKNVIKVYKTGCESGVFFILMELCEGGSVDKYMERCGGKLPLDVATYIILQVLDGLEYAHHADVSVKCGWRAKSATGVVHRDFKPGNIFLVDGSKYPIAKIADFGLAKAFETAGLSKHTRTGTAAGTPVFQPRQQIANYKYSKPEVDVWAAAASYYNMLTGNIPKDIHGKDVWLEMFTGEVVPIRRRNPQVPEKLAAVIDQALVEKPEIGIKTAAELKRRMIAALPDDIKQTVRGVL